MFSFDEFKEMYEASKHLKPSDFLSTELLDAVENRQYFSSELERSLKFSMRELINGEELNSKEFMGLKDKFLLQYWWEDNNKEILNILRAIQECLNLRNIIISQTPVKTLETKFFTNNKEHWIKFISFANYFREIARQQGVDDFLFGLDCGSDQVYIYTSLKYFKKKGLKVRVRNGSFPLELIDTVFNILDKKIEILGWEFILAIHRYLSKKKQPYDLYYFQTHRFIDFNRKDELIYPIGLLFRLSLKYVSNPSKYSKDDIISKHIEEVFEYSGHLTNILNLVNSGHDIGLTNTDHSDILGYIQRYTRLDQFYKIDQYNPKHVYELCLKLHNSLANKALPIDVKQRTNLIIEIFTTCMQELVSCISGVFNETRGYKKLVEKHSQAIIDQELINLSHIDAANKGFKNINDLSSIDYFLKPFIKRKIQGRVQYWIPNKIFFFMGFYSQLTAVLRTVKKFDDDERFDADKYIGFLQEDIIKQRFKESGLRVLETNGEYSVSQNVVSALNLKQTKNKLLETDVVVELDDRIIFFESKKKVLTTKAKNGDVVAILNDLKTSLIESQIQANRHCRIIRHESEINFNDSKKLVLGNREIIKVSITQFDYGTLHCSQIVGAILTVMLNAKIVSEDTDKNVVKMINSINEELKNFTDEFSDGTSFHDDRNRMIMFANCHFLNFFQILYILDRVKTKSDMDIETIINKAFGVKRMSTDCLDFYYEFEFSLQFKPVNYFV
ncbi:MULTISPECIES: hypothetical protein [Acinetobacter]|uniref:hypothetical protein n=1 Tax=Acinetobacter TaxID=469 RepID=UPI00141B5A12|nr:MULTISPECIES: hypothetical protein [Acinetobacter]MCS4299353.1 hypothetical protein [Acinetobacter guillouiae]MCW2252803.1 hypothetical protein [Acinetobacter sp. BIGb0204]NII35126.1 hypothetical protein [Acinetobacter sp. BIGb0196]